MSGAGGGRNKALGLIGYGVSEGDWDSILEVDDGWQNSSVNVLNATELPLKNG